ncbi:ScyD/ScyE family protein [Thermomonospora curvata]|uniref:ScyD/ScyE family protein n=1 Tax=Thermomonospora curvata (strain ATCC 19995 / DSM 43183 / JCM 3096 / KCTC 9072 / NBRC 15933 / NCIMB 10081 / Henssen B9) TaxID=471852 RepID=D1A4C7_THECD|nr:ScyD/ScyE family protein [Thermomonospora curvata]ACZ00002.1 hypothetical protein Tcur_4474 [Thermomonospora curvata DSM 43183]
MKKTRMPWSVACLAAASGVALALIPGAAARAQAPALEVIAEGLNNPRGVTLLQDGTILVAEAGTGGKDMCVGTGAGRRCLGRSGAIYQIRGHRQGRVVQGLPSVGDGAGREVVGPVDVTVSDGEYVVLSGAGMDVRERARYGPHARPLGTVYRVPADGRDVRVIADLVAYESRPDRMRTRDGAVSQTAHSNPWRLVPASEGWLVTDAGTDDLLGVRADGTITTEAVFGHDATAATAGRSARADAVTELAAHLVPVGTAGAQPVAKSGKAKGKKGSKAGRAAEATAVQSLPTGIVRGPDGAYYVGELAGMVPGAARVWRYVPGQRPQVIASGLTAISDMALDGNGDLVVLSMSGGYGAGGKPTAGSLHRIDLQTLTRTEIPTGGRLTMPTGMAIGQDGAIYISNKGTGNGAGQLVRVRS